MTSGNRPKATHVGTIERGSLKLACYRLEDGRQLFSGTGLLRTMGVLAKDVSLTRYVERIPGVSAGLASLPSIEFTLPAGGTADGYDAAFLVEVVGLYADALVAGTLHPKQVHMGRAAYQIQRALMGVAVETLIDEAVGYVASPGSRFAAFEKFLADQRQPWRRTLTTELQTELCRLYKYADDRARPPRFLIGICGWLNKLIYGDELVVEVRQQRKDLEARSNVQVLTEFARAFSKAELEKVLMLARESRDAEDFKSRARFHYRGEAMQTGWL